MITNNLYSLLLPPEGLPALHPEVRLHGEKVVKVLSERFAAADNVMTFPEYMQFCLYEPALGYYTGGLQKFGSDGDFVTAPELSSIFGECYADAIISLLQQNPDWSILELGPGRGKLAKALLTRLKRLGTLPKRYQLLEVSSSLRHIQKETLRPFESELEIECLDQPPKGFSGIVIANEVIDALVVERFRIVDGDVKQLNVSMKKHQLEWQEAPAHEYLREQVKKLGPLADKYESEICLALKFWLKGITHHIREGVMLFSDYGFSHSEYYSPERRRGTLRCHYRHHAHNDPLVLPCLQDITAWVNFSELAESAHEIGLDVMGYSTQAHFMMGSGRLQKINYAKLSDMEQLRLNQEIKQLTLPSGMGEQFRFMQLNKNCDVSLSAMRVRDLRYQL